MILRIKKLSPTAQVPTRATDGAAGFDLYADSNEEIWAGSHALIPTGIAMEIPTGCVGQIWPRSGLAVEGMDTGAGIIDADYRGEVKVLLFNHSDYPKMIQAGMRIAQLLIVPISVPTLNEVDELETTARGEAGFGSTGE